LLGEILPTEVQPVVHYDFTAISASGIWTLSYWFQ